MDGDLIRVEFPIPLKGKKQVAFTFSGLKNAVRLKCEELRDSEGKIDENSTISIAHAFQKSAITHLSQNIKKYFELKKMRGEKILYFSIVGGASANLALRREVEEICKKYDSRLLLAKIEFCSDNAAMIGRIGVEKYRLGDFSDISKLDISPKSSRGEFV